MNETLPVACRRRGERGRVEEAAIRRLLRRSLRRHEARRHDLRQLGVERLNVLLELLDQGVVVGFGELLVCPEAR